MKITLTAMPGGPGLPAGLDGAVAELTLRADGASVDAEIRIPGRPAGDMDFGRALAYLKDGGLVAREGWNGKGMFLYLVPGSTFEVNRHPLLGIYPAGTEITYSPHIDMKTADGSCVPWLASQTDILASDWKAVKIAAGE